MVLVLVKTSSSIGPESTFGAFGHLLSVQKKCMNPAACLSSSPKPSSFKPFSIPQGLEGSKSSSEKTRSIEKSRFNLAVALQFAFCSIGALPKLAFQPPSKLKESASMLMLMLSTVIRSPLRLIGFAQALSKQ